MGERRGPKQRVQLQVCSFPGLSWVSPGTGGGFRQRSVGRPDMRVISLGRGQGLKINMDGVWWTLDTNQAERAVSWELGPTVRDGRLSWKVKHYQGKKN